MIHCFCQRGTHYKKKFRCGSWIRLYLYRNLDLLVFGVNFLRLLILCEKIASPRTILYVHFVLVGAIVRAEILLHVQQKTLKTILTMILTFKSLTTPQKCLLHYCFSYSELIFGGNNIDTEYNYSQFINTLWCKQTSIFFINPDSYADTHTVPSGHRAPTPCRNIKQFQTNATLKYNGGQWENNIIKFLKEMKKYVSKLIFQKNIIKQVDPNYVGTFQQYIIMALIITDFSEFLHHKIALLSSWLALLEISNYQCYPYIFLISSNVVWIILFYIFLQY